MPSTFVFPDLASPARLEVVTSTDCPHCARVVAELRTLAQQCAQVSLAIRDVADAAELLQAHAIGSVPATVIDGEVVLVGLVTAPQVARILAARGTRAFDTERIRGILDTGRLEGAVRWVCDTGAADAVVPLLASDSLSERMGATLVLQQAHEARPGCLESAMADLIALLQSTDSRVRGDVADLLGTVGDGRAVDPLRKLIDDPDADVSEAARDALESLRSSHE